MPEQLVVRALWEAGQPVLPTFSCGENMALADTSEGPTFDTTFTPETHHVAGW